MTHTTKLLPLFLLAALTACNSASESQTPAQVEGQAKTPSDGSLNGDMVAVVTDCGAMNLFKVFPDKSSLIRVQPIKPEIATEGKPDNDKFTCVFQGAIALKDTLAVWNGTDIVVNRGKI